MNNPHAVKKAPLSRLVMGPHAVNALLEHAPERIVRVFTAHKGTEIGQLAERKRIPVTVVSAHELTKMVESDSHQSFVAEVKERQFVELEELYDASLILMLDQIFDPQNFGALLRNAECFGVDAVIWSKNRGADVTPVVAKASCGASELIKMCKVSNLATSLEKLQDNGFEAVASLLNENAEPAYGFSFAEKTVLIMGSEGEGIQPLLQKKADRAIYLPMQGKIQSLNVAQASAALLAILRSAK